MYDVCTCFVYLCVTKTSKLITWCFPSQKLESVVQQGQIWLEYVPKINIRCTLRPRKHHFVENDIFVAFYRTKTRQYGPARPHVVPGYPIFFKCTLCSKTKYNFVEISTTNFNCPLKVGRDGYSCLVSGSTDTSSHKFFMASCFSQYFIKTFCLLRQMPSSSQ